ncbi:putative lipase 8 precursor [Aspergillus brunneoviolaceus CBS 621.78]|uniref:Lipase 8 n=1 Tax=Aspergillus brunneoviolaceus CBS 621.78 TaxID=1450534 RepID=A0ACD1GBP4_9EURO|nr:putative lipase 8 precursor [Aspergillus brunneoviolaceus CBS 621.78]RAH46663.1 putative lipase 8 precursor [Aspergillus brunneoviolaceus CBS 621.78]
MLIVSHLLRLIALLWAVTPFTGATNLPRGYNKPLAPKSDPFYTPDDDSWRAQPPGSILKSRQVTIGSALLIPKGLAAGYQLLYRTTNAHGLPNYAVTTILIPFGAKLDRFISLQTGYDSANNDCGPSYGLQFGASTNASEALIELAVGMLPYLEMGIPLVVPDYLQVDAAFAVGPTTAYGVLDSMRAVLRSTHITGLADNATITMQGYSQGGLAAEWAGEYRSTYAPEVHIAGAAIGGMPVNISEVFIGVEKTLSSGLAAGTLVGIGNAYPEFRAYVDEHLIPKYRPLLEIARKECVADFYKIAYGYTVQLAFRNITDWFDTGRGFITDNLDLFNEIGVLALHGMPDFPMFVWKGTDDEVAVGIEEHDALVQAWCDAGIPIQYLRVHKTLHTPSIPPGLPGARAFMMDVFEGNSPTECTTEDKFGTGDE